MLAHVLFANLHLGGSWIAAVSESFFLKTGSRRVDRIAKSELEEFRDKGILESTI